MLPHHLHHLHLCVQAQLIQKHLQVLFHLDGVVVQLRHREDSHFAFPPHLRTHPCEKLPMAFEQPAGEWVTKDTHNLWRARTLCCISRKGSSMRSPPSWTIHHTSIEPSFKRSWLSGKWSMFFATSRAWWASVVSLTVSGCRGIF